jgi:hypothetical protein
MAKNKESLIGTSPVKCWEKHAARPLTINGKNLYLLVPVKCGKFRTAKKDNPGIWHDKDQADVMTIKDVPKPLRIVHLSSGNNIDFSYNKDAKTLVLSKPESNDKLMDVYRIEYDQVPVLK